ncbi:PREDICTED: transcriptional corepressor LEUNIG_HOMOLOG-like [Lupinus angustifolius]|uniref:transcriptional corepressor LEUNIG_HOMOLOG-like n=1 Tax=Lupinus angustifolius TaxID=3871 RepID=UPI00092F9FC3|nr:PREDICTED: transcriptional corepressor LEUNIG_HOMOLOG-like [Lupinus angustifolius]
MISQIPMSQKRPMLAQPHAGLIPSTLYNKEHLGYLVGNDEPSFQDLSKSSNLKFLAGSSSSQSLLDAGKQVQNQILKDSGIGICLGKDVPRDPLQLVQPKTNEALNLTPLDGWLRNVGGGRNQVLTSLVHEPNYRHQCQVLKTQNHVAVPAQILESTPASQAFTVPGISTKYSSQYLKTPTPKIESSNKDKQVMEPVVKTAENQNQRDQQLQSQDVEMSGMRKKTVSLRLGQNGQDCASVADGKPVDESVESFLSLENEHADHIIAPFSNLKRISTSCSRNENKGFTFEEVGCLHSSKGKVLSSHFSSDGKILASAGHEKKVFIWNTETFDCVTTAEEHSLLITDVRFRTGSTLFATSSFDRSVRLWDAARPTRSLLKLEGHAEQVMSLDFHPRKVDLLCSCDINDVIRLWNVNQGACMHITKGGSKQVRFQPDFGKLLATATGNDIKIVDVEADSILCNLKGHVKDILSICWDRSGNYIASVSEDSARIWSSDGKCIHELHSTGNKFQSCIFHPAYLNLLVIGGYQTLELWSPTDGNETWSVAAHKGLIAGLAESPHDELIASASHDCCVKLWK